MTAFRRLEHCFYSTQLQNVFYCQGEQEFPRRTYVANNDNWLYVKANTGKPM